MIKPKGKPRGRPIKKGQVLNPKGRGAVIPICKVFKEYTTTTIAEMFTELMNFSKPELEGLVQDDATPILRKNIAQVLLRDMKNSEIDYSERVLNRIIGPVPARSEVSGANGTPLPSGPVQVLIREYEVAKEPGQEPTPKA